jgi:hypothetical protein
MMTNGAQIPRSRPETQAMFSVGLFKIGVGSSLSYTVGPMKAASAFDKGLIVALGEPGWSLRRRGHANRRRQQMGVTKV